MLKDVLNNMRFDEAKVMASRIQAVISDHLDFVMGLNENLITQKREPITEGSVYSINGHHYCEFGRWFDSMIGTELGGNEDFINLGSVHEKMHAIAHRLLFTSERDGAVEQEQYQRFIALQRVFFNELWSVVNIVISSQCYYDSLTGLFNRNAFSLVVSKELEKEERTGEHHYIVMVDIDHFKRVNDQYGHKAGDRVLAQIARFYQQHVRKGDVLARYGGEEFILCISGNTDKAVLVVIERMRTMLESNPVVLSGDRVIHVTASFGISRLSEDLDRTINKADAALYEAKAKGRNQVVLK